MLSRNPGVGCMSVCGAGQSRGRGGSGEGALCGACVSAGAAGHGAKRSVGRRRSGGVEGWTALAVARTGDFGLPDADKDGRPVREADGLPALRPEGASMSVNRRFFVRGEALQCPSAGLAA